MTDSANSVICQVLAPVMSVTEARSCVDEIKGHLNRVRALLLDLDERRGWETLGYDSMRQCMLHEFEDVRSQLRHLYRELKAGHIEKAVCPLGHKIGSIPETHLRELGKLPPEQWLPCWNEAISTAPPKGVTAKHIAATVARLQQIQASPPSPDLQLVVGSWALIKTLAGNPAWDGRVGEIVKPLEGGQWGVRLNFTNWKCLRFYPDELTPVPAPVSFKVGNIVLIDCPDGAPKEHRHFNKKWGVVTEITQHGQPRVVVAGQNIILNRSDIQVVNQPSEFLQSVAEVASKLLQCENLDDFDRALLEEKYTRNLNFTPRQMDILFQMSEVYLKKRD